MEQVKTSDIRIHQSSGVSDVILNNPAFKQYVQRCIRKFWIADWGDTPETLWIDNTVAYKNLNNGLYDRVWAIYRNFKAVNGTNVPMQEIHITRQIVDSTGQQTILVSLPQESKE